MTEGPERWAVPDIDAAVAEAKIRNGQGIKVVLDLLGENIRSPDASEIASRNYVDLIGVIQDEGLNSSISVKLSSFGYINDLDKAFDSVIRVSDAAKASNVGFELDMEWTPMVDHTIEIAERCSKAGHKVTIAIQAYLNRSADDIGYLQDRNVKVRLVKGAYRGESSDFSDIQKRYIKLLTQLAGSRKDFSIGTHDPEILAFISEHLPHSKDRIEIGFLRGLCDETKMQLASNGWKVVEYLPVGQEFKAYVKRREEYLRKLGELGRVPAP
ncbi:MAG: proline dehydrogenase family protein [Euryarchaeota archaeon]|nr:proline dehydrogenase family protein [Euryarchaeota archaeon]